MNRILFVTNRVPTGTTTDPTFCSKLQYGLTFGSAIENGNAHDVSVLGRDDFLTILSKAITDGLDVINFVHGFKATFDDSIEQGFKIADCFEESKTGRKRVIVVFSWPSDGELSTAAYQNDKLDAKRSGPAIASVLQMQIDLLDEKRSEKGKVHVVCQSLGNFAFQYAVGFIGTAGAKKLSEVVLSAPVIPRRAFESGYKLEPLPIICERISLYFNPGDFAKFVTLILWEFNRMSLDGPKNPLKLDSKIAVINCGKAIQGKPDEEHRYLYENSKVIKDVNSVLNGVPSTDNSLNRKYNPSSNQFVLDG